jgi:hypothetical protein
LNTIKPGWAIKIICGVFALAPTVFPGAGTIVMPAYLTALDGQVLDAQTGQPLGSVPIVVLQESEILCGLPTGDDGRFTILGIAPGDYKVEISSGGYLPRFHQIRIERKKVCRISVCLKRELSYPDSSSSPNYDSISTTCGIKGSVIDTVGRPVPQVDVYILAEGNQVQYAQTDTSGEYQLSIQPGEYVLILQHTGYQQLKLENLVVSDSQELVLDTELSPLFSINEVEHLPYIQARISGAVKDIQTGNPIEDAGVLLTNILVYTLEGKQKDIGILTDTDGSFLIDGIPAGSYNARFSMKDYETAVIQGIEAVTDRLINYSIELQPSP